MKPFASHERITRVPRRLLGACCVACAAAGGMLGKLKIGSLLLKTGASAAFAIWAQSGLMGWPFSIGVVFLLFTHECGHVIAARRAGIKVGAPMFVPFLGAFVSYREEPDMKTAAWIALAGPVIGGLSALACEAAYFQTHTILFRTLAVGGFALNLINLVPVGLLDGGYIVRPFLARPRLITGLGELFLLALLWCEIFWQHLYIVGSLVVLLILTVPAMRRPWEWPLFAKEETRSAYYATTKEERRAITAAYFATIAALLAGLFFSMRY